MLPLSTRATVGGIQGRAIVKVLTPREAVASELAPEKCMLWLDSPEDVTRHRREKWAGFFFATDIGGEDTPNGISVSQAKNPGVVSPGDVIRVTQDSSLVSVLYRRGSNSNTLLATERCNSFCLMCSQPPRDVDDRWLVKEMLETIPLVDRDEVQLGISGGEPTLLGDDLWTVIWQAKQHLPDTGLHVLSNGRVFNDRKTAQMACALRHPNLTWAVPLYADCPEIHDYIVQSKGAWDETVAGLHNLASYGASIEIRIVVQRANVERLGELAYFLFRNFSFAEHVAFMGLEPIGFAKHNYGKVWIDPADCAAELREAVYFLANRGMTVSLYNLPLCTLPADLRGFSPRSISDWKNVFLPQCADCEVQHDCCGFFRTVSEAWVSRDVKPLRTQGMSATEMGGGDGCRLAKAT